MKLGLGWRIQLSASVLVAALVVAILLYVTYQANLFVSERLTTDLRADRDLVQRLEQDRVADLRLTAELVASFPSFKALLSTDAATVRDFLTQYQQRNERTELLIALDTAGRVIARTDTIAPAALAASAADWVERLRNGQDVEGSITASDGLYHAAAVPIDAGGLLLGFLVAGAKADQSFARAMAEAVHNEVVILGADRLLGSTLQETVLPWRSRREYEAAGSIEDLRMVRVAEETYAALATRRTDAADPIVVVLQSRDRALAPYRRIQTGLIILGLIATVAGVAGSVLLARTVTAPVAALVEGTRQVAAGNLDHRLKVGRRDEIGDLAEAFNSMTSGLRERADLQMFVSQSTVDMIHARTEKPVSAGERRTLTVFFSDIRGFTAIAERMLPEDAVTLLNRCFTLQAERVRKFGGDIDKYVGDSVVALFNGEDMALRAIRCAVEIQREQRAGARPQPDDMPGIGIGIVTGDVILGSIGGGDRLDYTVVGSNVNLCARLCSMAAAGEILLSESTYRSVGDLIAADPLEPLVIKGFSEPVPVYRMRSRL